MAKFIKSEKFIQSTKDEQGKIVLQKSEKKKCPCGEIIVKGQEVFYCTVCNALIHKDCIKHNSCNHQILEYEYVLCTVIEDGTRTTTRIKEADGI